MCSEWFVFEIGDLKTYISLTKAWLAMLYREIIDSSIKVMERTRQEILVVTETHPIAPWKTCEYQMLGFKKNSLKHWTVFSLKRFRTLWGMTRRSSRSIQILRRLKKIESWETSVGASIILSWSIAQPIHRRDEVSTDGIWSSWTRKCQATSLDIQLASQTGSPIRIWWI